MASRDPNRFVPPEHAPWTADPFDIFLARLFGRKFLTHSEGCYMVGYWFRGRTLITDVFTMDSIKQPPKLRP